MPTNDDAIKRRGALRLTACERSRYRILPVARTKFAALYPTGAAIGFVMFDETKDKLIGGETYCVADDKGSVDTVKCREGALGPYLPGIGRPGPIPAHQIAARIHCVQLVQP